jgi:hypothetical protein
MTSLGSLLAVAVKIQIDASERRFIFITSVLPTSLLCESKIAFAGEM